MWAITQMEPSDARMFVPCWDEPAFKVTVALVTLGYCNLQASWNVSVEHPVAAIALSNGLESTPEP